ncbi:stalk domain-containing protein [Symbiobacterium thermophilum]|nr:glucosaminidase domain-containing protein [Symbiobacterium thermophilum]
MRTRNWLAAAAGLALLTSVLPNPAASAASPVRVVLDGRQLDLSPAAYIEAGRTLAPVRGIVEALGVDPVWNPQERTVVVQRGDRYLKLTIDDRVACLNPACTLTRTLDVPARLVGSGRTFIPVRALAEAMGLDIAWDDAARTVYLSSTGSPSSGSPSGGSPSTGAPSPVVLEGVTQGQVITGPVSLRVRGQNGTYAYFYLVDPATRKGRMVAAGADVGKSYTFTPDPTQAGERQLLAAVRRPDGTLVYSAPVTVRIAPDTSVRPVGIDYGGIIDGPFTFRHELSFVATHVIYQLVDLTDGSWRNLATVGPGESYTWYPRTTDNGPKELYIYAYDLNGNHYVSNPVRVHVNVSPSTSFSSVKEGETVTGRARTLSVSANYPIQSVRFYLDGRLLASENNYWWTYGPQDNGTHTLRVEVTATDGRVHTVGPITFRIATEPGLWMYGVGPGQVITGQVEMFAMPNVPADEVRYYAVQNGERILIGSAGLTHKVSWTPPRGGEWMIYADAFYQGQLKVSTEPIYVRAYLGPTYGPQPIVEKSRFKDFAANLAVASYRETGMSAALQVAQAILETGWGQYVPVDKYTGKFSNNLFGIKGQGSAGSIVSTTWEVYNGQSYTVDAEFRAYNDPRESWQDHKDLLLTRPWYEVFREVMSDPVLGAWGLRKGGYATDPEYPTKLIRIMKENNLFELDVIQF